MNNEIFAIENTELESRIDLTAEAPLKNSSRIMRSITLGLQIAAMLAYYVPSIITGGNVALAWLVIGVVQTALFCAVFFRNERTRTGISIALMVIGTLFNLGMLFLAAFFELLGMSLGLSFITAIIYALCSLLAVIFALCFPRKFKKEENVTFPELNPENPK